MFADFGHSAARPSILSTLLAGLPMLRLAPDLAASRARLADMDDHMLADIGLTRAAARIEAARPVWDVPANWRA
jgi:Domain of unknown function (DUF1127)